LTPGTTISASGTGAEFTIVLGRFEQKATKETKRKMQAEGEKLNRKERKERREKQTDL